MAFKNLSKPVKYLLLAGIVILVGAFIFSQRGTDEPTDTAQTTPQVQLFSLEETEKQPVAAIASGEIESLEQVTLSSELFGTVTQVHVNIGDSVVPGQTLVQFRAADKVAQLTQVQADYESALAAKESLLAQIDAAQANHQKLVVASQNGISAAEAAVRTAENNLQQVSETGSNVRVDNAYDNLVGTLQSVEDTFVDRLVTADSILGIDNTFVNDEFEKVLGVLRSGTLTTANSEYLRTRRLKEQFVTHMGTVSTASSHADIDATLTMANTTIEQYQTLFSALTTLLDSTRPIGSLTQSMYDGLIASVNAGRSELTSQKTALSTAKQAIQSARNSYTTQEIAYEKAVQDLADTKAQSKADIDASLAGITQLEASLASQDASIKRALGSVAAVQAELAKTSVRSPIHGQVANIAVKRGEIVSSGALVAEVVNINGMQVKAFIPESAFSSISVGNTVLVEGQPVGKVLRIAPSINQNTKKIEVIISIESSPETSFVVGQFVDLEILADVTQEDTQTILVPLQAVRVQSDTHDVFVVKDGIVKAIPVQTGQLIGDKIEIHTDLSEYEAIVASVRGLEDGQSVEIVK